MIFPTFPSAGQSQRFPIPPPAGIRSTGQSRSLPFLPPTGPVSLRCSGLGYFKQPLSDCTFLVYRLTLPYGCHVHFGAHRRCHRVSRLSTTSELLWQDTMKSRPTRDRRRPCRQVQGQIPCLRVEVSHASSASSSSYD